MKSDHFSLSTTTACIDYIPVNYTLTFSSEIVNHTFEICLTNDNIAEYNETFELQLKLLTQGTNAVLQADRNLVEVTILNDDGECNPFRKLYMSL